MQSKSSDLKQEALALRKQGLSIKTIETKLLIPRSTLSGWFKNVVLTEVQKSKLKKDWENALVKARKGSALWHNTQKNNRLEHAKQQAIDVINKIDLSSKEIFELAIAMLYLGEGSKKHSTNLGNSDPLILKFFLLGIEKIFGIDRSKIRCSLHLRADQNPLQIKKFWSNELNVPIERFMQVSIDKRTIGKPTYPHYKGVCIIECGTIAIQRKLVYLSRIFCEKIIESTRG